MQLNIFLKNEIMKKLILIMLSLIFINCQKKEGQSVSISGEVSNYPKNYVIVLRDTTGLGLKTIIDSVELDQYGKFHFVTQKI